MKILSGLSKLSSPFVLQDSPIRIPAEQFLTYRAIGAPAIVMALAAQGTFRGFKDTKTPLYAIGTSVIHFFPLILYL